ncbi:hypothetical protein IFM89_024618 [Coptis chinensis]|uniref:Exportin-2 C-terminal domain-containing protein n=1 Tax=Coptis chinensis TaxID=261450 RepID=A0A835LZI7_9MAGN|nr:hypothetical protein IFM89_024618 [Coptis chinensis]
MPVVAKKVQRYQVAPWGYFEGEEGIKVITDQGQELMADVVLFATVKFHNSFVIFISLFLIKHGPTRLVDSINSVQPNAATICGRMLDSIVTLLSRREQERVVEEPEMPDIGEAVGYTATFVPLHNAGKKKDEDPVKEIKDPKEFLVKSSQDLHAHLWEYFCFATFTTLKLLQWIRSVLGSFNAFNASSVSLLDGSVLFLGLEVIHMNQKKYATFFDKSSLVSSSSKGVGVSLELEKRLKAFLDLLSLL